MKKFLSFTLALALSVILGACSSEEPAGEESSKEETITYESEFGPVEVPENPERIVALAYAPNLHALDIEMSGVDQWSKNNPLFEEDLEGVAEVTEAEPESILAENPDLIIAGANMENLEELEKIAPTVTYTWGKLNYLEQQIEIGKLVGKEDETRAWAEDFEKRAADIGSKIKEKHGEDTTVTVIETDGKGFYLFGEAWGRGTEILYQAMDLKMPENVQKAVSSDGYYEISQEVLAEYAGDYIVLSRGEETDMSFTDSEVWQSIPAVQNDNVIEIDTAASSYSDPTTLEYLLEIYSKGLME
ncbi:Iron(3+)-hydroxamate-binding protein FhuD precursor [Jeotgalicoccus saudimassiliensis]|jgi:iron complex transport system substrate-binding protein|uniref:Iron(3+)-hydroxamate-binding protein FhuD n=1 Tax=Jeotgalicoccus saudimassiliensis TaxID=1461582 RepID=A0A078M2W0_9STAP|nr:iron-hydroxamate ABC transporter substrate-binding protein [Jeotgalicoccus saudimassiliensis]MDO5359930.1 iron-hydroxamate ABC transporter substrate-binding protein [Jeotgalicoccus sp.]CEA01793.1 Iron(3+)-hydroxamate-binding protein FhuD precursor [Jeotgalicoccus saudimassiliensis]HBV22674.1 ABC transporter substrate-binding protein [Jeotgalicoccus sp.]